jgi:hypothetical protein
MRKSSSIYLPRDVKVILDKASAELGIPPGDLVRDSIRAFLFVQRFRTLRAKMMAKAQVRGVFTDEDVFMRVS